MVSSQEQLRQLVGEVIPDGGLDVETMFTDEEIDDFLAQGQGVVERAAYYAWRAKAGNLANLTNVIEGNSSREMELLHRSALRMMDRFSGYVETPSRGRARIGKISRRRGHEPPD